MTFETILVPTDFSNHAEKAFGMALEFARTFGSKIEVLHVYHLGYWVTVEAVTFPEAVEEDIRAVVGQKLSAWAEHAKEEGIDATTSSVFGTPSQSILQRAEELPADLIVMGTRGLGAVKHMLLGSVAERCVRGARCPVLTVAVDARTGA